MHNSPILAGKWAILKKITATEKNPKTVWRRGWDSNPRLSFPNTRFPSVLLKPLGHLSAFLGRQKPNKLPGPQQTGGLTRFCRGNKSRVCLLHFLALLRGSAIGSTPAFGAGYPGSSPGPGAILGDSANLDRT